MSFSRKKWRFLHQVSDYLKDSSFSKCKLNLDLPRDFLDIIVEYQCIVDKQDLEILEFLNPGIVRRRFLGLKGDNFRQIVRLVFLPNDKMKTHLARLLGYYPIMRDVYQKVSQYSRLTGHYDGDFIWRVIHEKDLELGMKFLDRGRVATMWLFSLAIELENIEAIREISRKIYQQDFAYCFERLISSGNYSACNYSINKVLPIVTIKFRDRDAWYIFNSLVKNGWLNLANDFKKFLPSILHEDTHKCIV